MLEVNLGLYSFAEGNHPPTLHYFSHSFIPEAETQVYFADCVFMLFMR